MTAAYDNDSISYRKQEMQSEKNNSDIPVDFTSRKIAAINLQGELVTESNEENGAANVSENCRDGDQNKEDELLDSESSVESETVNSSITVRCCVDVVNKVVVNGADGNCTTLKEGNSVETCFMLRTQKNVAEIIHSDAQDTFSCLSNSQNSTTSGVPGRDTDQKLEQDNIIDKKSPTAAIADRSKLQSSSNLESNVCKEKSGFNYDTLTDKNKSVEPTTIFQELVSKEILSVSSDSQQNGVKTMPTSDSENLFASSVGTPNLPDLKGLQIFSRLNSDPIRFEVSDADVFGVKSKNSESSNEEFNEEYDPECEMSFHEAVRAGDARSVEILMARGVVQNIDEPDWNVSGDPPLLVAATNHSLPVLRALLSNGCDPGVRSPRGETALHRAIINGSPSSVFEIVEELLKYGCPSTVKEAGGGLTALHMLTRQLAHAQSSKSLQHNFDMALNTLSLLAKVGPIDAKDHHGRSALHLLASSSTFGNSHKVEIDPMIKTILEAGADPALQNDRGETPLHEALECGALSTAFLLIPHTPVGITSRYGETPLHIAARKNQSEVVDSLLKRGEDPSFQDAGGNTPLHLASARGFHHTISLLVTSPLAQLEKSNDDGLTSLQVAAESGFVNAVRLLLKAGADPSQSAHCCLTTLHRHPDISTLINHELTRRRQLAA